MKNRLVDKAQVLETFGDLYDIFDDYRELQRKLDDTYDNINDIPYVDAIPVEWIKKYNSVRGWEVTVTTQNAIDNMLNAWEKENEL